MNPIHSHIETLETPSAKTRVFDRGEGPPVVVLHGWGGRIESMAPVLTGLDGFRVVAVDLPGFGEAPVPDEVWGTPEYARFVAEVLDQRGITAAAFVGHSFGAKTSLYLAATDPARVERLVLQGSSGLRQAPSAKVRIKRGLSRAGRAAGRLGAPGRALKAALYRRLSSSDYRDAGALRPILVKVVNEDLRPLLGKVRVPTLLIWGTQDDAAPLVHGQIMEKEIPDAGLVTFEGAGHFAYLDDTPRFLAIVRHFLGAPAEGAR